ncbi:MAG: 23S rRNA (adenine(2503)-C(2))-methyltransferase RlmN [Phycisphaerales bacterium]|nr:MAG: 23S rRNA (adenine(2503)-C(2))-methyltransferase RlmN [Phycisphaerales bacterium]
MLRSPANHIFQHTPETLSAWCAEHGMPAFRAKQILEWVYRHGVIDPALMTNLSGADRQKLSESMVFLSGEVLAHQVATDGTQKLLVEWSDGEPAPAGAASIGFEPATRLAVLNNAPGSGGHSDRQTECVMIPSMDGEDGKAPSRRTACISSQVGCPVGCRFCASGLGGLDANLSAGRIVEQAWRLGRLPEVGRITNIVFMGMGEPLSNFDAVSRAVRTLAADWGMGIGARRITISTVGLPKYIDRLANEMDLPVTLALSLHATTDELRRQLIPWSEFTTIADLLAACQRWFKKTGREITLEYTLLRNVNDRPEHAQQLAGLAKSLRANVNLIRYNEVDATPFERPRQEDVHEFQRILRARHVNAHIRASRGRDIAAACGQLRHEAATT